MWRPASVKSTVHTASGIVKSGPGQVFWVIATCGGTARNIQLNDSTDDSGTDRIDLDLPTNSVSPTGSLDPPIDFATGIYVVISAAGTKVTIGYN